jgi:membrane protease YdiL (CAAX protease family)
METSNVSGQSIGAYANLQQVMGRYPLFFFFLMAYAFSWIVSIPYILAQWGILYGNFIIIFVLKSFGPFLAAYLMTAVTEGKEGVLRLRRSIKQVRAGWRWYLFILLGIPALMLLGISALPGALASFQGFPPHFLVAYLVNFILIFFGGGALGEEPGWRGFALPRLLPCIGALRGTVLLGVLWTFWHLPDLLTDAQKGGPGVGLSAFYTGLPIFFMEVMALSIIFTWVYNHTGGSVFIAILLHASYNAFGFLQPFFSAPSVTSTDLPFLIGVGVPALLILILTRGQLGYQPSREQPSSSGKVGVHPIF